MILADPGPDALRQPHPRSAPASVGAGLGDQLRSHQLHTSTSAFSAQSCRGCCRCPSRARDQEDPVEIEVFGFGGLCVMVEGAARCRPTPPGESPNFWQRRPARRQACALGATARAWKPASTAFSSTALPTMSALATPTLCKGRFTVGDDTYYAIEEPTSLNTLELLPDLACAGVRAPSRLKAVNAARPTQQSHPRVRAPPSTTQGRRRAFCRQARMDGRAQQCLLKARATRSGAYYRPRNKSCP